MIINDFWLYENERQSTFLGLYVPQSLRMTATAPTILLSLPPITPPIPITCLHRYCWHCHHHQYHAAVPFTTAATTITVTITTTYADCAATTEAATTTITRFQRLWMPFLGNHNSSCRIMVPNIVPVIVVIVIILIVVIDSSSLSFLLLSSSSLSSSLLSSSSSSSSWFSLTLAMCQEESWPPFICRKFTWSI